MAPSPEAPPIDAISERIALPGGEVELARPRDAEALLSEESFERVEFLPYWAGGRVVANDWSPEAMAATAANAERNGASVETLLCSWASPAPLVDRGPWELVLAADVLYERRNVEMLLALLPRLVDERGRVLIADPGRPPAEAFLERAAENWHVRTIASRRAPRVSIHRLRRRV